MAPPLWTTRRQTHLRSGPCFHPDTDGDPYVCKLRLRHHDRIVSPDDNPTDLLDKVEFYRENGARSVWVIDPQKKRVYIYKPSQAARQIAGDGTLTDDLLPGFELPVSELFA